MKVGGPDPNKDCSEEEQMKQETIVQQAVIETPRFVLRPLRMSDTGLLDMYASDRRVAEQTTSIPHPLPPGAAEAFVAKAQRAERNEHVWAMDASDQGGAELMGVISLKQMEMIKLKKIGIYISYKQRVISRQKISFYSGI
jgi:RimJ/RimL family protein N-acetyltransferase